MNTFRHPRFSFPRSAWLLIPALLVWTGCERTGPSAPEPAPAPPPKPSIETDAAALKKEIPLTGYLPPAIAIDNDAALFDALDLTRPGLETVRKALDAGDPAAARAALANYFRTRTDPRLVIEGEEVTPASPEPSENRLAANSMAEQAVRKDYSIAGIQYKFPGAINWELNPTTQPGYKGAWSGQFHTQLNRMHYWRELAGAWRTTGNPVYRDEVLAQMRDWQGKIRPPSLEQLPQFIKRYRATHGSVREFRLWLPLDTGQRAANTTRVFETLRQDPAMDDETLLATVRMLGEHGRVLSQLRIDGNHLAIATMGLATVAVMFPEFKESTDWLREAVARVGVEMDAQVYPDGAQMELTPWYHFTALRNFAAVLEVAAANGYTIPRSLLDGLRNMCEYIADVTDPLLGAPPLNDSEWLSASSLRLARVFFPDDPVFAWFAGGRVEGTAPDFTSLTVPYAGQAVMRTGWDKDALYLLMEYGPFGTGHMHEDKLGLSVAAYGRRLLADPGRNKYEASTIRDYSVNASAHSTVLFDGLFQARRLAKGALNKVSQPVPVVWQSTPEADYVIGSYGADERELFALPTNPPGDVAPEWFRIVLDERRRADDVQTTRRMIQHRHVLLVKPHYWVIVDTFDPLDEESHNYTTLFQLGEGHTAISGTTLTLGKPGEAGMALASSPLSGNATLSVISGQKEPFYLGWSFIDGEPRPSPASVLQHSAVGKNAAAHVLVPHPAGSSPAAPEIEWLDAAPGKYKLRVAPGAGKPPVEITIPADGSAAAWKIGG